MTACLYCSVWLFDPDSILYMHTCGLCAAVYLELRWFGDGQRDGMVEARVSAMVDDRAGRIFSHDVLVAAVAVASASAAAAANQGSHQTAQSAPPLQPDTDWRVDRVHVGPRRQIRRILYANIHSKQPRFKSKWKFYAYSGVAILIHWYYYSLYDTEVEQKIKHL